MNTGGGVGAALDVGAELVVVGEFWGWKYFAVVLELVSAIKRPTPGTQILLLDRAILISFARNSIPRPRKTASSCFPVIRICVSGVDGFQTVISSPVISIILTLEDCSMAAFSVIRTLPSTTNVSTWERPS